MTTTTQHANDTHIDDYAPACPFCGNLFDLCECAHSDPVDLAEPDGTASIAISHAGPRACPDCGASKSVSHPRCAKCYYTRKHARRNIRSYSARRAEGREHQQILMARFASPDDTLRHFASSHWITDSRGLDERQAASLHTGAPGDLAFSAPTLSRPIIHRADDNQGAFYIYSDSSLSTRVLDDMGMRRKGAVSQPAKMAKPDAQPRRTSDICPPARETTSRCTLAFDGFFWDGDDYFASREAGPEFYIEPDACLPNLTDAQLDDYDERVRHNVERISGKVREASDPMAHLGKRAMTLPHRPWAYIRDRSDAWTAALLEAELRRDYPQLFRQEDADDAYYADPAYQHVTEIRPF